MEKEPNPGEWWVMFNSESWFVAGTRIDGRWFVESKSGAIRVANRSDFLHVEPPKPREVRAWVCMCANGLPCAFKEKEPAEKWESRDPAFPVVEVVIRERKDGGE